MQDEGGVEAPYEELRVDEDLVVGTVAFDSAEDSLVRKLALDRLRNSLKKGMMFSPFFFFLEKEEEEEDKKGQRPESSVLKDRIEYAFSKS